MQYITGSHLNTDKIESNLSGPGIRGYHLNALVKAFNVHTCYVLIKTCAKGRISFPFLSALSISWQSASKWHVTWHFLFFQILPVPGIRLVKCTTLTSWLQSLKMMGHMTFSLISFFRISWFWNPKSKCAYSWGCSWGSSPTHRSICTLCIFVFMHRRGPLILP